ncbi:CoA transferase [Nocardia pseudovaccinii]|uniref:CoA transferase n=1 Tax=Nocardia pseudovaccinii TaxID=189540 RepID=UPI0007A4E057|nr:CoA transferase [Nocardia pseudovaccinii]
MIATNASATAAVLRDWVRSLCPSDVLSRPVETQPECAALAWAASGAMDLTGRPDGAPAVSPAAAYGLLVETTEALARITAQIGSEVRADPGLLLVGRAGLLNLRRGGRQTAGGAGRLLRTSDGWCAITLSRQDDIDSVPAILGMDSVADDPWEALTTAARAWTATDLADRAQLLGVPAAALPSAAYPADSLLADARPADARPADALSATAPPDAAMPVDADPAAAHPFDALPVDAHPATRVPDDAAHRVAGSSATPGPQCPWQTSRIAQPVVGARLDGLVVVDLSSMWAGPLCAHLLGRAGARVIKVESTRRPDGARRGDPRFFDWLHGGHEQIAVDFHTPAGRETLRELVSTADVVIEASRPRAMAQLGLAPGDRMHRDGQVWLSLTGYGRAEPMRVAFGDDAAVAGGLVGWDAGEPVFCGDAIADPLTGICAALAVCCAVLGGGGQLIDLSMRATAAAFASAPALTHGPHRVRADGADWVVECPRHGRSQRVLRPRVPQRSGMKRVVPHVDS